VLEAAEGAAERTFEAPVSTGVARLAAMDGLRGIAIATVLWYHVWQISWFGVGFSLFGFDAQTFPETGFMGVELFFFLSGFCVFYPFAKAHFDGRPAPGWRHFYARRFFKIVPSYVLAIGALIAFGAQPYAAWTDAARDVGFHLLFVHNWFAATFGTIDGVLWSLAVEVQFYAVFPLVCWAFLRRPLATTVAMFAAAAAFRLLSEARDAYFLSQLVNQLPAVLDLFAAGMLVAYGYRFIAARRPALGARTALWTAVAAAGLVWTFALLHGLYGARYDHDGFTHWQAHHRSEVALALGMLGLGSLFAHRAWVAVIANPLTIFLGAISYNLYIWHQIVARLVASSFRPATANPHDDPHWQMAVTVAAIVAAIAMGAAVTYLFERPIMAAGARPGGRRQSGE
jgi:peptidoglycan/LPS O-acetylase OafA/YrhL